MVILHNIWKIKEKQIKKSGTMTKYNGIAKSTLNMEVCFFFKRNKQSETQMLRKVIQIYWVPEALC